MRLIQLGKEILNLEGAVAFTWIADDSSVLVEFVDGRKKFVSGAWAMPFWDLLMSRATPLRPAPSGAIGEEFGGVEDEGPSGVVGRTGLRDEDEAVVQALRASPEGLHRTQINRSCFHGHKSAEELDRILNRLVEGGRIAPLSTQNGGLWISVDELEE